ncbi:MAG: ribbon-helix-helix protein, CopG family [Armatimonadetes bacterium]|nr:ribbon-helix-helix protein, CopG family [Armatimonadota bacterium]
MAETVKVYISMPREFLEQVDQLAEAEHLSRSAFIREAVKVYMGHRSRPTTSFFRRSTELRKQFAHLKEDALEALIDDAVADVRSSRAL